MADLESIVMDNSPTATKSAVHPPQDHAPTRIAILGTGGTIACTHGEDGLLVPTESTASLLDRLYAETTPQAPTAASKTSRTLPARPDEVLLEPSDIMQLDSSAITLSDLDTLIAHIAAARRTADAVIVLHGTDTLEESALAAELLLPPGAPVVFTGAQRPADDPYPDGLDNLAAAITYLHQMVTTPPVATHPSASAAKTWIVFGGATLPAWGAFKAHTTAAAAFATAECDDSANTRDLPARPKTTTPATLEGLVVPIIGTFAGDDGLSLTLLAERVSRSAATQTSSGARIDGLVLVGLGSGNVPPAVASALTELLAIAPVPVLLCSRVPHGGVSCVYGGAGGGGNLAALGDEAGARVESAGALRPSQARMVLLAEAAWARAADHSS